MMKVLTKYSLRNILKPIIRAIADMDDRRVGYFNSSAGMKYRGVSPAGGSCTWTAPYNCWCIVRLYSSNNSSANAYVDGIEVCSNTSSNATLIEQKFIIPLHKDQSIIMHSSATSDSFFAIYEMT